MPEGNDKAGTNATHVCRLCWLKDMVGGKTGNAWLLRDVQLPPNVSRHYLLTRRLLGLVGSASKFWEVTVHSAGKNIILNTLFFAIFSRRYNFVCSEREELRTGYRCYFFPIENIIMVYEVSITV